LPRKISFFRNLGEFLFPPPLDADIGKVLQWEAEKPKMLTAVIWYLRLMKETIA